MRGRKEGFQTGKSEVAHFALMLALAAPTIVTLSPFGIFVAVRAIIPQCEHALHFDAELFAIPAPRAGDVGQTIRLALQARELLYQLPRSKLPFGRSSHALFARGLPETAARNLTLLPCGAPQWSRLRHTPQTNRRAGERVRRC
jgi:hypothetical protein